MHPKAAKSLTTYIKESTHGNVTAALKAGIFQCKLGEGRNLRFRGSYKYKGSCLKPRKDKLYPSISGEILLRGESTTTPGDRDTTGIAFLAPPYRHNGSEPRQFRINRNNGRKSDLRFRSEVAAGKGEVFGEIAFVSKGSATPPSAR